MALSIGVLTREGVLALLEQSSERQNGFRIHPFDVAALQPTSYDVSITSILDDENDVTEFERVEIPYLGFKKFVSGELFRFPDDLIGHLYLRSSFARKGLIPVHLGRVEAGWVGRLVFEVFNASRRSVWVEAGNRLVTIEFVRLSMPVQRGYVGRYSGYPNRGPSL